MSKRYEVDTCFFAEEKEILKCGSAYQSWGHNLFVINFVKSCDITTKAVKMDVLFHPSVQILFKW